MHKYIILILGGGGGGEGGGGNPSTIVRQTLSIANTIVGYQDFIVQGQEAHTPEYNSNKNRKLFHKMWEKYGGL